MWNYGVIRWLQLLMVPSALFLVSAKAPFDEKVAHGWLIESGEMPGRCFMTRAYKNGSAFTIAHDAINNQVQIMIDIGGKSVDGGLNGVRGELYLIGHRAEGEADGETIIKNLPIKSVDIDKRRIFFETIYDADVYNFHEFDRADFSVLGGAFLFFDLGKSATAILLLQECADPNFSAADVEANALAMDGVLGIKLAAEDEGGAYSDEGLTEPEKELGSFSWSSGGWRVWDGDHDCTLLSPYPMSLKFDQRLDRLEFKFFERSVRSLSIGQLEMLHIAFAFDDGNWRQWAEPVEFEVESVAASGTMFRAELPSEWFLNSLAERTGIGLITSKGAIISAYQLDGSAAAIVKLRECAAAVDVLRPSDPFTK